MLIDPALIQFARIIIASEVKKLVQRGHIRLADAGDVRDEMMLILVHVWHMYTPDRGTPEAFINQVVKTRLVSILRLKYAKKRGKTPGPLDNVAFAVQDKGPAITGAQERCDLEMDLAGVLSRLTNEQREIVEILRRENISDAAKALGLARGTLRSRLEAIREIFYDAGLEEYLR